MNKKTRRRIRGFFYRIFSPARLAKLMISDGLHDKAEKLLRNILRKHPENAKAWLYLGKNLICKKDLIEGIDALRVYTRLRPNDADAALLLFYTIIDSFDYDYAGAKFECERITKIPGAERSGLLCAGILRKRMGDFEGACEAFLDVAKEDSEHAKSAWMYAAQIAYGTDIEKKIRGLAQAADPSPEFRVYSDLYIPWVHMTHDDTAKWFESSLAAFEGLQQVKLQLTSPESLAGSYFFGCFNNLDHDSSSAFALRKKFSSLLPECCPELLFMPETPNDIAKNDIANAAKKGRLRLGVMVQRYHADYFATAFENFFRCIDKNRFEIILFRLKERNKDFSVVDALVDAVVEYEHMDWRGIRTSLISMNLDVFMREDFGPLLFNGFIRVAPVQCVFFDPFQSMGTPEVDYSILFGGVDEILTWRKNFSEKIACLSNNFTWPAISSVPPDRVTHGDLGIPAFSRILFTWQQLFRWRVDDDEAIAHLLRRNSDAWLVAIANPQEEADVVFTRWSRSMPDVMNRIKLIGWQPTGKFLGILHLASALIPPPYSSGIISSATALSQGLPFATCKGKSFSSRTGSLAYEAMGVEGLIAGTLDEYVAITQRILDDGEWREEKKREIKEKLPKLYDIAPQVRELEDFLEAAFKRAKNGDAPMHWCRGEFVFPE